MSSLPYAPFQVGKLLTGYTRGRTFLSPCWQAACHLRPPRNPLCSGKPQPRGCNGTAQSGQLYAKSGGPGRRALGLVLPQPLAWPGRRNLAWPGASATWHGLVDVMAVPLWLWWRLHVGEATLQAACRPGIHCKASTALHLGVAMHAVAHRQRCPRPATACCTDMHMPGHFRHATSRLFRKTRRVQPCRSTMHGRGGLSCCHGICGRT